MEWVFKFEPLFLVIWAAISLGYLAIMYYREIDRIRLWLKTNWEYEFHKIRWYSSNLFTSTISGIAFAASFSLLILYFELFQNIVIFILPYSVIYYGILITATARIQNRNFDNRSFYRFKCYLFLSVLKLVPIICLFIILNIVH